MLKVCVASTNCYILFVFFPSVQAGWLSFGNEIFWIVVTDNGVTQSVVLKEPFWNFDGRRDKSLVPTFFSPPAVCHPVSVHHWIDICFILSHTNKCLFIPILSSWCVLMDVCHVIEVLALSEETQINNFTTKWHCNELFPLFVMTWNDGSVWRLVHRWLLVGNIAQNCSWLWLEA